jgi:hypothetical protein
VKEQFNASVPSEDRERFAKSIADVAEKMTTYAGSAADPGEYGKLIAARFVQTHCLKSLEHPPHLRCRASMDARSATMRWM